MEILKKEWFWSICFWILSITFCHYLKKPTYRLTKCLRIMVRPVSSTRRTVCTGWQIGNVLYIVHIIRHRSEQNQPVDIRVVVFIGILLLLLVIYACKKDDYLAVRCLQNKRTALEKNGRVVTCPLETTSDMNGECDIVCEEASLALAMRGDDRAWEIVNEGDFC